MNLREKAILLVLLNSVASFGASGAVDGFTMFLNKRTKTRPRKRVNGVESTDECARLCNEQTGFECTMFTIRQRGMRCFMYGDREVKSITSDLNQFLRAVGFVTFARDRDAPVTTTPATRPPKPTRRKKKCLPTTDPLGLSYNGTKRTTVNGRTCQRWDSMKPHRPTYRPARPKLHKNFCRNPDRDSGGTWCYTTDPLKRWEYCKIPVCKKGTSSKTEECYLCNGVDYRGKLNETINGKTCQRWASSIPHQHSNHPYQQPGKNLDENFCRNPDGDIRPWCYTTDISTRWEYCPLTRCTNPDDSAVMPRDRRFTTDCIEDSGGNYRGSVSRTKTGKICAQWSSQFPHKHTRTPENYPCSGLEGNFCRNPTGKFEDGVWCYTTDPDSRWEICDIPKCSPGGNTSRTITAPTTTASPATCGAPEFAPSFMVQPFNIQGGRVAPSRSKRQASPDGETKVLGGDSAVHGSWPWSVSLRYLDQHFCGGTLIHLRWVLTAAHCLDDSESANDLSVKVGHNTGKESEIQMRRVLFYSLHERYNKGQVFNDIALIELLSPFQATRYVKTACLPPKDYIVPGDNFCVVTGWGKTHDPNYKGQLKQAVLPVHSYSECLRYMGRYMRDKTQMCAGWRGEGHDTCRGDSGGPLSCLNDNKWTVQGVTSWGSGCEDKNGSYGSYTRVSKYVTWINRKMRE